MGNFVLNGQALGIKIKHQMYFSIENKFEYLTIEFTLYSTNNFFYLFI